LGIRQRQSHKDVEQMGNIRGTWAVKHQEYMVVHSLDLEELEVLVNKYLAQSYVLIGGICVNGKSYYQAMARIEH